MNQTGKILLVEDDSAIVTTLRRVLTDEGYAVTVETTGSGGLARAKAGAFDAVITDFPDVAVDERLRTAVAIAG